MYNFLFVSAENDAIPVKTGFVFGGDSYDEKIENMLDGIRVALDIFENDRSRWKEIQPNARKVRSTWKKSVEEYY